MVTDYEAAWLELQTLIAGKSQHGREPTLIAMAEIAERHRVPAGELSRLLRLYGVEVERARLISTDTDPQVGLDSREDVVLAGTGAGGGHHRPGGHDGSDRAAGSGWVGSE